jgi:hypothetical protein
VGIEDLTVLDKEEHKTRDMVFFQFSGKERISEGLHLELADGNRFQWLWLRLAGT